MYFFPEPLRRSSRSEYFDLLDRKPHGFLFDRSTELFDRVNNIFCSESHVQSLRSLPALRRLAENQLSDSPSAYRKPLGFLSEDFLQKFRSLPIFFLTSPPKFTFRVFRLLRSNSSNVVLRSNSSKQSDRIVRLLRSNSSEEYSEQLRTADRGNLGVK